MAISGAVDALSCVYAYNLFPSRYGLRSRPGSVKWGTPIPASSGGIKTIIPFNSPSGTASSKLFACTNDGIYDVTAGGTPVKKHDFADKTPSAGWCSWTSFSTPAGPYVLIADQRNGYIVYDGTANNFTVGALTGVNTGEIVHVAVWKNRLWFTQRDKQRAWYMNTVGTFSGDVTPFEFGSKFKFGGHLVGVWNWTTDGGAGIDDYLVAMSSQGDLAVYAGWDPSTATGDGAFTLRGVWYLGQVPLGRRMVLEEGGDLLIHTSEGVLSLTQLVSGSGRGDDRAYYLTAKINPLLRQVWRERETVRGWEINTLSKYAAVIIAQPTLSGERPVQWLYSYETKGWFFIRDLPIYTIENFGGRVFFGDTSHQMWEMTGLYDAVDPSVSGSGTPVEFSMLTSYQGYNEPGRLKRVHMIRAHWVGQALPQYVTEARYDFSIAESGALPAFSPSRSSAWDIGAWDSAVWSSSLQTRQASYGATGMGRYLAVAMRGTNTGDAVFMGADVLGDSGGLL